MGIEDLAEAEVSARVVDADDPAVVLVIEKVLNVIFAGIEDREGLILAGIRGDEVLCRDDAVAHNHDVALVGGDAHVDIVFLIVLLVNQHGRTIGDSKRGNEGWRGR